MNHAAAVSTVVLLLGTGVTASAKGWEISLFAGWTAPTFQEQVAFSPDIELPAIPGASIRQDGVFDLKAVGSFALGGSVSYFFSEHVAIEGRVDTINFDIDTVGPRFEAQAQVVPGLPAATIVLDAGMGTVNVERLFPLSLNLKARTGGRARFVASGGLSYLPHVRFDAHQPVSLAIGGFGIPPVDLASVELQAGAVDSGNSRWGFNGGAGVEIEISPNVAVVGDFRVHSFQSQTFVWQRSQNPSSSLGEILVEQLETLPPIEVELTYFQVTGGVAFRF
jgi:opacity protein-like surface antigen